MLVINKDTFSNARKLLADASSRQEGVDILKKMLEIKQAHLWRSDVISPCCGSLGGFTCQLNEETSLLEQAISLIEQGDLAAVNPMLDRLENIISDGMGQKETPELIERLTFSPDNSKTGS